MNYQKHYDLLITRAKILNRKKLEKTNTAYVYYEQHHIIPVCMYINNRSNGKRPGHIPGDPNAANNLVLLTAREHFVAHQLLVKMYPEYQYVLIMAVHKMISKGRSPDQAEARSKSKLYEWIRSMHAEAMSILRKGKTNVEIHGTAKALEMRQKQSLALKGRKKSQKFRDQVSQRFKGKKHSSERRKTSSESRKGTRMGHDNHFFGQTHTAETRKKISDQRKGTINVKDRLSNKAIGQVSIAHPKYLSGEWVSVCYGTSQTKESNEKRSQTLKKLFEGKVSTCSKAVLCVETGKIYQSLLAACTDLGRSNYDCISRCARGITNQAYGYTWRFV